jgi:hypothetical protein
MPWLPLIDEARLSRVKLDRAMPRIADATQGVEWRAPVELPPPNPRELVVDVVHHGRDERARGRSKY